MDNLVIIICAIVSLASGATIYGRNPLLANQYYSGSGHLANRLNLGRYNVHGGQRYNVLDSRRPIIDSGLYQPPPVASKVILPHRRVLLPKAPATVDSGSYQTGEPIPHSFSYSNTDEYGNTQSREEVGDGYGNVRGSYSYQNANGVGRSVNYVSDKAGYRAEIVTNEPGTDNQNPADVKITANPIKVDYQPGVRPSPYRRPVVGLPLSHAYV
ncbi:Uncharacterised protein g5126 [Pycnogonum litorale]